MEQSKEAFTQQASILFLLICISSSSALDPIKYLPQDSLSSNHCCSPPPSSSFSIFFTKQRAENSMGLLVAIAKHLDGLVGPVIMLLYPLYASMRAIESPSPVDDQQWLTYWVIYSLITLFELSFHTVLHWFPLWPYVKLVFCLWLVLPAFNGAAYIYDQHVRRYFNLSRHVSDKYGEQERRVLGMASLDARKAVERYIDSFGSAALHRVVRAAEKEARKH